MCQEAKKALNRLRQKGRYLTLVWTKAHIGTIGNERADKLAKEGTTKIDITLLGRPMCDVKNTIKKWIYQEWNRQWQNYTEGRMSKQFLVDIEPD